MRSFCLQFFAWLLLKMLDISIETRKKNNKDKNVFTVRVCEFIIHTDDREVWFQRWLIISLFARTNSQFAHTTTKYDCIDDLDFHRSRIRIHSWRTRPRNMIPRMANNFTVCTYGFTVGTLGHEDDFNDEFENHHKMLSQWPLQKTTTRRHYSNDLWVQWRVIFGTNTAPYISPPWTYPLWTWLKGISEKLPLSRWGRVHEV